MGQTERRQNACTEALALAATLPLPVEAWTPTPNEAAAIGRNNTRLVLLTLIGFGTVAIVVVAEEAGPEQYPTLFGLAALMAVLAFVVVRLTRAPKVEPRYGPVPGAAPPVAVEAGADAVTVRQGDRVHSISYDEAEIAWRYDVSKQGWTGFLGIDLTTPLGPLALADGHLTHGRNAAAAIVGRLDAIGRLPPVVR